MLIQFIRSLEAISERFTLCNTISESTYFQCPILVAQSVPQPVSAHVSQTTSSRMKLFESHLYGTGAYRNLGS
jgi:hypothetical protein